MTLVTIRNPYYEERLEVVEERGDIECQLVNIRKGFENFLFLHRENGNTITINPSNLASVEIANDTRREEEE